MAFRAVVTDVEIKNFECSDMDKAEPFQTLYDFGFIPKRVENNRFAFSVLMKLTIRQPNQPTAAVMESRFEHLIGEEPHPSGKLPVQLCEALVKEAVRINSVLFGLESKKRLDEYLVVPSMNSPFYSALQKVLDKFNGEK
jgi:hypothetical protein